MIHFPAIRATCAVAVGPLNGIFEMWSAADAPIEAITSKGKVWS